MRKIFIADAHLRHPDDHNYLKLINFLNHLPADTDTLFILGDLFEFWIGYPPEHFPEYLPILQALEKLRGRGVKIIYFEGNHDFHLGSFFERTLEAKVYRSGAVITLEGRRVYLCHGDEINTRDYGYRLMRGIFHSSLTRNLTSIVPASWARWIAATLGSRSRARHKTRRSRWHYETIVREFAGRQFGSGCDAVVTGHFHIPLIDRSPEGQTLLSLGDWITHFTYGEWNDGIIELKVFEEK